MVKGIHFEGLRVLGKPEDFARYYYESGADELIYVDTVASLYGRNSLLEIIEKTSKEIFIPLTVGGGLRTVDDIRKVLRAGADKVSINTAAVHRPELIREASQAFGSSTIVVSIEAIRQADGTYEAYTDYGREKSGLKAMEWAKHAVELGAGELMVTSIDREGTGRGFDTELIRQIAEAVRVPVIAAGGAGKISDVLEVVQNGKADAVCVASLLHYECARHLKYNETEFPSEGNTRFLMSEKNFSKIHPATLAELKKYLKESGVSCRS